MSKSFNKSALNKLLRQPSKSPEEVKKAKVESWASYRAEKYWDGKAEVKRKRK